MGRGVAVGLASIVEIGTNALATARPLKVDAIEHLPIEDFGGAVPRGLNRQSHVAENCDLDPGRR